MSNPVKNAFGCVVDDDDYWLRNNMREVGPQVNAA